MLQTGGENTKKFNSLAFASSLRNFERFQLMVFDELCYRESPKGDKACTGVVKNIKLC